MNLKIQLIPALIVMFFSCNAFAGISKFRCDTIPYEPDSVLIKFERVNADSGLTVEETVWPKYVQKNIDPHVPSKNKAPAGIYTVIVQFILDKEGNVSDVKTLTNSDRGYVNGVLVDARFYGSRGMVIDAAGNIYVADAGNHAIRKITPDGEVSTFYVQK